MAYELIFDVRSDGVRYWFIPAAGLAFVALALVRVMWRRGHPYTGDGRWRRVEPYVALGFAVLVTGICSVSMLRERGQLADAMETGRYVTVEGVVSRFVPMPEDGHPSESFEVAGRRYEYSDYRVTAGLNRTQAFGGQIREGLRVRLADVNGTIARLEIARE